MVGGGDCVDRTIAMMWRGSCNHVDGAGGPSGSTHNGMECDGTLNHTHDSTKTQDVGSD